MFENSVALIFVFGLTLVLGEVIVPCRKTTINPMKDFDLSKIIGKEWYDIAYATNYERNLTEMGEFLDYKCPSVTIAETEVVGIYRINFNMINTTTNKEESITAVEHCDRDNQAVLYYTLTKGNGSNTVIETDYKTWLFTYGCSIFNDNTFEYVNIKSRSRNLDKAAYDKLVALAIKFGFSKDKLVVENQSAC